MDEDQQVLDEQQDGSSEDVENGGVGPGDAEEQGAGSDGQGYAGQDDDPYGIKKRLGMQAKKHQREMRRMQEQLAYMQSRMGNDRQDAQYSPDVNPYPSPGQPNPPGMNEEEKIQRAVRYALQAKDEEERRAKDAERHAHVQKQYQRLNSEFDKASEKYEDFDDVVRGDDAPFTTHVRDALLLVDNPAEVAYKLGKNREELQRIAGLHPLDQAREINKLSFALMSGNHGKGQSAQSNPMGTIKANPAYQSSAVTDKTPASAIRARMKAGTWK